MKNGDRHHPIRRTMALVPAGGRGSRLQALTEYRVKPAVPLGRGPRCTDFALSDRLNPNVRRFHRSPGGVAPLTTATVEVLQERLA